jgi:transposase InsO family protein
MPSVAATPDERWSTDLYRVWAGKDGWLSLAIVIDCCTREILGWHLSKSAKSTTAESALEQALINRYGTLGRINAPFLLRSDNGLVFTSRSYTRLVKHYGLQQEFITPHCPEQNGLVERAIRTIKEQCVHRQRFKTLQLFLESPGFVQATFLLNLAKGYACMTGNTERHRVLFLSKADVKAIEDKSKKEEVTRERKRAQQHAATNFRKVLKTTYPLEAHLLDERRRKSSKRKLGRDDPETGTFHVFDLDLDSLDDGKVAGAITDGEAAIGAAHEQVTPGDAEGAPDGSDKSNSVSLDTSASSSSSSSSSCYS